MADLMRARQVGELLGLSPATVLRRWRAGELPGFRISGNVVRFDPDEIAAWLDARRGPRDPRGGDRHEPDA